MQPTDSQPLHKHNTQNIANHTSSDGTAKTITVPPNKKKSKPSTKTRRRLKEAEPLPFTIDGLSHDGRGVAIYGNGFDEQQGHALDKHGKKVFVSFALPGEQVEVKLTNSRASFEEGDAIKVTTNPNIERAVPPCPHFGVCGGCNLQHWQPGAQISFKQSVLAEMLMHQANTAPEHWLDPIVGDRLGYRTKARLGVRYVVKKQTALVGFRERSSNFLAELNECHILDPRIGFEIENLKALISTLESRDKIAQLELAMGEYLPELPDGDQPVALIVRNLEPLSTSDIDKLKDFFAARNWQLYLQSKGVDTIERIALTDKDDLSEQFGRLYYELPEYDLTFEFIPTDFTQVNLSVNRQMTKLACDLLDLKAGERVLDLFSGLGNFSLPLARLVGSSGTVVGVEGSDAMTARAADNARRNGINNTQFYAQDLTQDCTDKPWANQGFDALLIDPPRSGAWEIMQYLPKFNAERIVYVSCNPATLARDTKALLEQGYRLTHAGVMDMFCHTGHVESIARFEKI
ncbi:23S rRNA (uracil(1939)-C(5))-methyltransferase RlmD [Psychrobacter sp. DM4]|uniref:23S rRNA (uracil(1939)-C(5))-methyltransferase RlmD n=1 Tax=Psychrobacter sp. DM4 TaxID=3440637 RepID=UPI003F4F80B6